MSRLPHIVEFVATTNLKAIKITVTLYLVDINQVIPLAVPVMLLWKSFSLVFIPARARCGSISPAPAFAHAVLLIHNCKPTACTRNIVLIDLCSVSIFVDRVLAASLFHGQLYPSTQSPSGCQLKIQISFQFVILFPTSSTFLVCDYEIDYTTLHLTRSSYFLRDFCMPFGRILMTILLLVNF